MPGLLAGKRALITGAANGMGRATARLFAQQGAAVAVVDILPDLADEVAEQIQSAGARSVAIQADVAREGDVERAVAAVAREFGGLDILVNNAGVSGGGTAPLDEMSLERWDRTMDVNLRAHLLFSKAAFPLLSQQGGVILGTASGASVASLPNICDYAISKAGVAMLTRQLAAEWGKYGIRANCVSPGFIDTGFGRPRQRGQEREPANLEARARRVEHIPLRRIGQPEEVARVFLFLASPLASYVSGVNILIDGGLNNMLYSIIW